MSAGPFRGSPDDRAEAEHLALVAVAAAAAESTTEGELLELVTTAMARRLYPESFGVLLTDPETHMVGPGGAYQGRPPFATEFAVRPGDGITGAAAAERRPVRVADVAADPRYLAVDSSTASELAVPMVAGGSVLAVINVESATPAAFTERDEALLATVAGIVASGLRRLRATAEAERAAFELRRASSALVAARRELEAPATERAAALAEANEHLKELDRLKTKFVADMSHELRTPVSNLRLYAHLLEHGAPERRERYLAVVHTEIERLSDLLGDLLNLGRLESERPTPPESVDLNDLCARVVADCATRAREAGLDLRFDPGADVPRVAGEPAQLTLAVDHLVRNALSYTPQGWVRVTTDRVAEGARLRVTDSGVGLDPEDFPHLFERFYRGRRVSQQAVRGTGLGLSIVRAVVDQAGGHVEATPGEGGGACFSVWLTAAEDGTSGAGGDAAQRPWVADGLAAQAESRDWRAAAGVILDMDGVLWVGRQPLPGLASLFACLARRGLPFVLATNNATRLPGHWAGRLAELGVAVPPERILTSASVAARFAARRYPRGAAVYAIGEEGLLVPLADHGFDLRPDAAEDVRAVIVGYDRGLTYAKLRDASVLLRRGADFIATNGDVTFPTEHGPLPGVGASLAALTAASGRTPEIVGKPEAAMFELAAAAMSLPPATLLMVGDRLDTDIAGARRAGLASVLVTTGIDDAEAAARSPEPPDAVLPGLEALAAALCG